MIDMIQYFMIALLGMMIHFAKVKVKDSPALNWSDYWKLNLDKSILAFLCIIGGIILANEMQQLNFTAAFFIGYGGDSIMNRWDKKNEENNKP